MVAMMPLQRPDAVLSGMVADACRDPSLWPVAVDWMVEEKTPVSDVALLYAGSPPDYVDGLPQKWLIQWMEATGERSLEARSMKMIGKSLCGQVPGQMLDDIFDGLPVRLFSSDARNSVAAALRAIKRGTLNSQPFRSLRFSLGASIGLLDIELDRRSSNARLKALYGRGFRRDMPIEVWEDRPNRCIQVRQRLTAVELIPPEDLRNRDVLVMGSSWANLIHLIHGRRQPSLPPP